MNVCKQVSIVLLTALVLIGLTDRAWAVYVDEEGTLTFCAKLQTRATFRMQDAEKNGFTYPLDTKRGDLVQWRNLALIEIDHDLKDLTQDLDILYPFKRFKIQTKYHLVARFMYEALYNVGADGFRDVRNNDKENIDEFREAYDLWEAYVDFARGPAFFRIGRQILAWGETDIFRLLDGINPLDNTFGGPFEDLDDRRIPLWMLRGSYNLGRIGPFSSLTIEGFWVPGNWDAKVGPWAPFGTPYMAPDPKVEVYDRLYINRPAKKMSNSRWGGAPPVGVWVEHELFGGPLQDVFGCAHHLFRAQGTGGWPTAGLWQFDHQRRLSIPAGHRGQHEFLGAYDQHRVPGRNSTVLGRTDVRSVAKRPPAFC